MALDPTLQRIYDTVSRTLEQRRRAAQPEITGGVAERVGMRSPQIAEAERKSRTSSEGQLSDLLTNLLMQGRQEERQERLTEEEWDRQLGLNRMDAQQQMQYLQEQLEASAAEAERGRQFTTERQDVSWDRQRQLAEEQSKDRSKSAWLKLLTNIGIGAATGGLMPGTIGAGNALKGLLAGGAMGGATTSNIIGQSVGENSLSEWLKQYGPQLNLGGSDPTVSPANSLSLY